MNWIETKTEVQQQQLVLSAYKKADKTNWTAGWDFNRPETELGQKGEGIRIHPQNRVSTNDQIRTTIPRAQVPPVSESTAVSHMTNMNQTQSVLNEDSTTTHNINPAIAPDDHDASATAGTGDQPHSPAGHAIVPAEACKMGPTNAPASLPPGVEEIRRLHGENIGWFRTTLENAIRIGEILTNLKNECGHGKWLPFVAEHLPFCKRTAQVYMGFYREREETKYADFAHLPMCRALSLMSNPTKRRPKVNKSPADTPMRKSKTKEPEPETQVHEQAHSPENQSAPIDINATVDVAPEPESGSNDVPEQDDGALNDSQPAERRAASTNAPVVVKAELTASPDAGTGALQPADNLLAQTNGTDRQIDEPVFKFLDGTEVAGWQEGVVSSEKLERELKKIANLPASVPLNERLAQQAVFAAGACAINRASGTEPDDGTLKAVENALMDLRNCVVAHKKYRP